MFESFAVPAHAQESGVTVSVVLSPGERSYYFCGSPVGGVVRVTNNHIFPIALYPSSDSVQARAFLNDQSLSYPYIARPQNIGEGMVIQPGETKSFAFVLILDVGGASQYPNAAKRPADEPPFNYLDPGLVYGYAYHSTTYDPNAPAGAIFSGYKWDEGFTDINIACGQSRQFDNTTTTTTTSTTQNNTATNSTTTSSTTSSSSTLQSPEGGSSECIIATATFGSELSPEVQFLRNFRDRQILQTFAGSNFMTVFNSWYYSFSPAVAQHIRGDEPLRDGMKLLLYPLLGILHISSTTFSTLKFQPELAALTSGIVASALIGLVYLTLPLTGVLWFFRHRISRKSQTTFARLALGTVILLTASFMFSELLKFPVPMMIASAGIVISVLTITTILAATQIITAIERVLFHHRSP